MRRKALGDKKNIPADEAKNNKVEIKTQIMENLTSQRNNNFQVLYESASAESMLVSLLLFRFMYIIYGISIIFSLISSSRAEIYPFNREQSQFVVIGKHFYDRKMNVSQ